MSIKSKIFAAAATLTMVGGIGTAGMLTAGTASAATPSCGKNCIDIFSQKFGTHKHPNFVLDVYQAKAQAGQPVILYQTSNYDPGEDFTISNQGTVNDFYKAGLVSASLNLHYSKLWAYEIEYSPNGGNSGLCVGVATTAVNGTPVCPAAVRLSAKTVWVKDSYDSIKPHRPADQRLGHQLLAPVRAQLPGQRLPDRQAASAADHLHAEQVLQRHRLQQPVWGANFAFCTK